MCRLHSRRRKSASRSVGDAARRGRVGVGVVLVRRGRRLDVRQVGRAGAARRLRPALHNAHGAPATSTARVASARRPLTATATASRLYRGTYITLHQQHKDELIVPPHVYAAFISATRFLRKVSGFRSFNLIIVSIATIIYHNS